VSTGLRIRGLVQGVGFRPAVWHVAHRLGLHGDVRNDGDGVWVRLRDASPGQVADFRALLQQQLPPLARIDSIEVDAGLPDFDCPGFDIVPSDATTPLTGIVPDAATCPACLAEIRDPANRRYRYPFTNCTHCGPRLSIIRAIPYDRVSTSMASFRMCDACESEYRDPADRRYHAQPNACASCGPRLWVAGGDPSQDPLQQVQQDLRAGRIVAIKGIGGFHLACDALNAKAVEALRQRKRRYAKPFALMARDLDVIRRYCQVSDSEAQLLAGPAAPITLLPPRGEADRLPAAIAPDQATLGFMLPYSPLHHLLLDDWDTPLVMTSGNLSDEPQCIDNRQAVDKLAGIADRLLLHDREIVNRVDDSVLRVMAGRPRFLRRARGYAPAPLLLHDSFRDCPPILALGGELKNTVCLLEGGRATLSQHLGDLEDAATSDEFERSVQLYRDLFAFAPQGVAIDRHPDYRSSRYGRELARRESLKLVAVQHHHAHIAALMAEQGMPLDAPPVLGIALDGLGFGDDGGIWGGEFLLADFSSSRRVARLMPAAMPGATQAILEPWRNLWGQLQACGLLPGLAERHARLPIIQYLQAQPLTMLETMLARGINTPLSSSAGRLFDAVAAALSLHHARIHQEGQAAIALENLASTRMQLAAGEGYPLDIVQQGELLQTHHQRLWEALFDDLAGGRPPSLIAARFHAGLADSICAVALQLAGQHPCRTIALSGGVWQNRVLLERCMRQLQQAGLQVLHHEQLPSNDGGLSLGQAAIAAAQLGLRP